MPRTAPFTIKPITQKMCSDIASVHALCFNDSWTNSVFTGLILTPGVFGYIIQINNAVQGFIIYRNIGTEGEILTIAVTPNAQRKELGLRLVQEAKSHAIKNGLNALFLEVAVDNVPAKKLYAKTGFSKVGQRSKYYRRKNGLNADSYTLMCDLSQGA